MISETNGDEERGGGETFIRWMTKSVIHVIIQLAIISREFQPLDLPHSTKHFFRRWR